MEEWMRVEKAIPLILFLISTLFLIFAGKENHVNETDVAFCYPVMRFGAAFSL